MTEPTQPSGCHLEEGRRYDIETHEWVWSVFCTNPDHAEAESCPDERDLFRQPQHSPPTQQDALRLAAELWEVELRLCGGDHQRTRIVIDQAIALAEPGRITPCPPNGG